MQKTKLGITVGMLGAALYFMGLINFLGLIVLAGYVLLFESNEWLKMTAVKAVAIVVSFQLMFIVIGFGDNICGFFNSIFSAFHSTFTLTWPLNLDSILSSLISIAEKAVLIILGIKSFSQGSLAIKPIDRIVNKNM